MREYSNLLEATNNKSNIFKANTSKVYIKGKAYNYYKIKSDLTYRESLLIILIK